MRTNKGFHFHIDWYEKGREESMKIRKCDTFTCPCTLTYWDNHLLPKIGQEMYNAFLDGWSDAVSGTREHQSLYT